MIRCKLRDLLGRRGTAAVEFAIFLPIMLIIFMGTVELATAYRTSAKLNAIVANIANAVSIAQATTTSGAPVSDTTIPAPYTSFARQVAPVSLPDLCYGAALGTAPYPNNGMTLNIASVTEESTGEYDEWEYDQSASGGTCSATGGTTILTNTANSPPAAVTALIKVPCDNVIIVQATLPYSGLFGLFIRSPLTLTQTAYIRWGIARPRPN